MLDKSRSMADFEIALDSIFVEFKKLTAEEQSMAVILFEKCQNEMRQFIKTSQTLASFEDFKATSQPYLQENQQDIYSDPEKDDTNDILDSSADSALQQRVDLIVQKLGNDLDSSESNIENDSIVNCVSNETNGLASSLETASEKVADDEEQSSHCIIDNDGHESNESCNEEYSTIKMIKDPSNYSCILCKKQFNSYISLTEHVYGHKGSRQSCFKCKNSFENAIAFLHHTCKSNKLSQMDIGDHSIEKLLCCPYCGKKYSTASNLRKHIRKFCEATESNLKCSTCHRTFSSENKYVEHEKKKELLKCKKCHLGHCNRALLREHNTTLCTAVVAKYSCLVCQIVFPTRSKYREHMKIFQDDLHKQMKKSSTSDVWCKQCMMQFVDQKSYKKHCRSINHLKAMNVNLPEVKAFICEKCGKSFYNKNDLIGHIKKIHEKEPTKCDKCSYSTTTTSNMSRHQRDFHEKTSKKYACDKCPSFYKSSSTLKAHIVSAHTQERNYGCDACDKKFKLKNHLTKHKEVHEPILPFACNHCFVKFRRAPHLKRHIMLKHEENVVRKPSDQPPKKAKPKPAMETRPVIEVIAAAAAAAAAADHLASAGGEPVFSCMDVQSGELVMLSNMDMLLNNVHVPPAELWQSTAGPNELYSTVGEPYLQQQQQQPRPGAPLAPGGPVAQPLEASSFIHLPAVIAAAGQPGDAVVGSSDMMVVTDAAGYEGLHALPLATYYDDIAS